MLTIVNIENLKYQTFDVGNKTWKVVFIETDTNYYTIHLRTIGIQQTREEALLNISRKCAMEGQSNPMYQLQNVYKKWDMWIWYEDMRTMDYFIGVLQKVLA